MFIKIRAYISFCHVMSCKSYRCPFNVHCIVIVIVIVIVIIIVH